jgi:hypothetical protein
MEKNKKPQRDTPRKGWSLNDISEDYGLSVPFLRLEVKKERLRARRFGRRLVILDDDLQAYLASGSSGNRADAVHGSDQECCETPA